MRRHRPPRGLVALVALATLLAGCAAPGGEPSAQPAPRDANGDDGGAGAGGAAGPPRAAFEPVDISHPFTEPPRSETFDLPPGAPPMRVKVWVAADERDVCATSDANVRLVSPSGTVVADVGRTAVSAASATCDPGFDEAVSMDAGTWTVEFTGSGVAVGRVVVAPEGG